MENHCLQNGSAGVCALIDDAGDVVQFLTYEGTLTATNGDASGEKPTDIGSAGTSSTSVGCSLQLAGSGQSYSDVTWQSAASSAPYDSFLNSVKVALMR